MLIGLTGKSCSGKNYAGLYLKEKGFEVWDLDLIGHDGLDLNIDKVISIFGENVVYHCNGTVKVDRKALGKVVFENPSMRTKLEGILYPWMEQLILDWELSHPGEYLVINGALLFRSGIDAKCKAVIYVDAPYEDRLKRALARDGVSVEDFEKREASQTDVDYRSVKYRAPLFIVQNNNGTERKQVNRQIDNICDNIVSNEGIKK